MEKPRVKYMLQFFGGRGAGASLGGGRGKRVNVISSQDVWSIRNKPGNAPYVDEINKGVGRIENDFPGVMNTVQSVESAELGGADKTGTLGFWRSSEGLLAINENYTNPSKMDAVYDKAVASGFHPSRGDVSGTQAVTLHEMGHALTDYYGEKIGVRDIDVASEIIVNRAYRQSNGRGGTKVWGGKISGYAKESNAECVAEAVADYYCNGSNAHANSRAIMNVLKSIN